MKRSLLLLAFCLFSLGVFAQQYRLTGTKISNFQSPALEKNFYRYSVFSTDVGPLLRVAAAEPKSLDLRLAFEGFPAVSIRMKPNQILADNYFTTIATDRGPQISYERPAVYPFISTIDGHSGAQAALTVAEGFLYGSFKTEGREYFIEPLWYFDKSQPRNLFVLYESGDVKETGEVVCGAVEVERETEQWESSERLDNKPKCGPSELEIAVANDYQMVVRYGSVNGVIAHNVSLINATQANWNNDFSIPIFLYITTQWVPATQAEDPWPVSDSRDELLDFFRGWANAGGFGLASYDLGHWRSPRIIYNNLNKQIVGATYQFTNGTPTACSSYRYSLFSEIPALPACGLRTITSHEMGHSFTAGHSPNPEEIMYPVYVDCTDLWADISITQINNGLSLATCLTPSGNCPVPGSVGLPENLEYLCEDTEECYTIDENPCIATFSVTTDDPYLQITVTGRTICLKSLSYTARISRVIVTPLDYCGNSTQDPNEPQIIWRIYINYPVPECLHFQSGDNIDRQEVTAFDTDDNLVVRQNNDFLSIEDLSSEARNKDIQVFDLAGRQLLYQQGTDHLIHVHLGDFQPGILVVKVAAGDKVVTKKITHF